MNLSPLHVFLSLFTIAARAENSTTQSVSATQSVSTTQDLLGDEVAKADLVVLAEAGTLAEAWDTEEPDSEISKKWQALPLKIERVLVGSAKLKGVLVACPKDAGVKCVDRPGYKMGERGIWILHRSEIMPNVFAFSAVDVAAWQPATNLEVVENFTRHRVQEPLLAATRPTTKGFGPIPGAAFASYGCRDRNDLASCVFPTAEEIALEIAAYKENTPERVQVLHNARVELDKVSAELAERARGHESTNYGRLLLDASNFMRPTNFSLPRDSLAISANSAFFIQLERFGGVLATVNLKTASTEVRTNLANTLSILKRLSKEYEKIEALYFDSQHPNRFLTQFTVDALPYLQSRGTCPVEVRNVFTKIYLSFEDFDDPKFMASTHLSFTQDGPVIQAIMDGVSTGTRVGRDNKPLSVNCVQPIRGEDIVGFDRHTFTLSVVPPASKAEANPDLPEPAVRVVEALRRIPN